jgi:acyl carrier protein
MMMQGIQIDPDVVSKIMAFMQERFPRARQTKLSIDDSLLDSSIIDSMGILELVNFIESEFSITVDGEDLLPENFQTVMALATFVQTKLQQH